MRAEEFKDDLCTVFTYLAPLTRPQRVRVKEYNQQMNEANKKFSKWFQDGSEKKLIRLHDDMVESAKDLLQSFGWIVSTDDPFELGRDVLIVHRKRKNFTGPELPLKLEDNHGEVLTIYDPYDSFDSSSGTDFHDSAGFDGSSIYLSNNGVRSLALRKRDVVTLHEVLHAALETKRREGKDIIFHGDLYAIKGKKIGKYRFPYDDYMGLDELATHAYELFMIGRNLEYTLSEKGAGVSEEKLKAIIKDVKETSGNGVKMSAQLKQFLARVEKGIADDRFAFEDEIGKDRIIFQLEKEEEKRTVGPDFIMAKVNIGTTYIRVPVAPSSIIPGKPTPSAINRYRKTLMRRLSKRIAKIKQTAIELKEIFQATKEANSYKGKLTDKKTKKAIDAAKEAHGITKPLWSETP